MHSALLSFNTGEVTPYARHRIDLDKIPAGAELCENFLLSPYGSLIKRPGLQWLLATTNPGGVNCHLLPFVASTGDQYLIHFAPDIIRVYDLNGTQKDTALFMVDYVWPSPAWNNGLRAIQTVQLNDVAFIVHPGTFPIRLRRVADTDWTTRFIPFTRPPMKDENTNKTKTLTVASNPVAPDWANGENYQSGDVVFTNCEWECTADHTANSTDNKPGSGTDWRDFWKRKFYVEGDPITILSDDREQVAWEGVTYTEYAVGDMVVIPDDPTDNVCYCLVVHATNDTSPGSTGINPGIDPNDDNSLTHPTDEPWLYVPKWSSIYGVYNVDECWHHNNIIYKCLLNHLSSDTNYEPGVGVDWTDAWSVFYNFTSDLPLPDWIEYTGTQYIAGQKVSRRGRVYQCILDHFPEFNTRPGAGVDWEDYWIEVSRMVEEFEADNFSPGLYMRISPERDEQDFQTEITAQAAFDGQASEAIAVQGGWNFTTYGTWRGIFQLQRSANNAKTWTVIRSWESDADRNIADSGIEDEPVLLRLKFFSTGSNPTSATTPRGVLAPELPSVTGYALLDNYVNADEMTGFAHTALLSGNTYKWAECPFNSRDGFPRAIALHEGRLVFAGTASQPVSLWLSASDDFLNFETGTEADDAIAATLALSNSSPIRWLASQRRLFIGTKFGEWAVGSETSDQPLTPSNFLARQYTAYGTHTAQPLIARDATFFLERKGRRLRELAYDDSRGSYDAVDLTRLAEHLFRDGIAAMAWQQTREPALWAVTRTGTLLHFAYNRPERVAAWSRHTTTGGTFLHCAVVPSDDGDDHVFFLVLRGSTTHLERFPADWLAAQEAGAGFFHLDGTYGTGVTISIPSHLRTTGITRLLNETTETTQNYTGISTQAITSQPWAIGKKISSRFVSLPIDLQAQDGTTQARDKRVSSLRLSLYQSRGGSIWNRTEADAQPIKGAQDSLTTGWTETVPDPGHVTDLAFRLTHTSPFPFTLRSAVLRFQVHER